MRREDGPLLRGQARFLADIAPPGCLDLVLVRSPHAHARIGGIDVAAARAAPAVVRVYTAADLAGRVGPLPVLWQQPGQKSRSFAALARDVVRYVGEPVAAVVAPGRYAGEDAAEQVEVHYDPLPAVTTVAQALAGGTLLYPDWGDNVALATAAAQGDVDAALRSAACVVRRSLHWGRQQASPLEPRGIVAVPDPGTGRVTVWASTQGPHIVRRLLGEVLGVPEERLRVIAPAVGGAFGSKFHFCPEDALTVLAALELGRPVRFVEDRREHLLSTVHAREQFLEGELGLAADGRLLGLRVTVITDAGAHLHTVGAGPTNVTVSTLCGPYHVPVCATAARLVVTNKTPFGSYRGFGAPQATWLMEALLEEASRTLGRDPADLRRQNAIPPHRLPYRTPAGAAYDSGNYPAALEQALDLAGYAGLSREQAARAADPDPDATRLGIGVAAWVHGTGWSPSARLGAMNYRLGGYETATVRMDPSGGVTVLTGLAPQGQGTATTFAQIAAAVLDVSPDRVTVLTGDTDLTPYSGMGLGADRGVAVGGTAVLKAARLVREKLLALGAHQLEIATADAELAAGTVRPRGASETGPMVALAHLAQAAYLGHHLPPGIEPGLEATVVHDPPEITSSYGVVVAEVEVDAPTATPRLRRITVVSDCGVMINQTLVEGQIHGGVGQAVGDALLSELCYDDSGQLITGTLADYLLPSAPDVPPITIAHLVTPAPSLALGAKGMAEGPNIGVPAAVALAVEDALRSYGVRADRLPVTPSRVWDQMHRPRV